MSKKIDKLCRKVNVAELNYIHLDPLSGRWQLVGDHCDYYYSSAGYYEMNKNLFPFLKDVKATF